MSNEIEYEVLWSYMKEKNLQHNIYFLQRIFPIIMELDENVWRFSTIDGQIVLLSELMD